MYTKSILRSLILDGGVAITDPIRLRDLLQEQSQSSDRVNKFGTIGGGLSIGFGVLMMSLNPAALLATVSGGYAVYLGQKAKATSLEEKEFRFLSRHGRIINLLGDFAKSGTATDDEILSAYESLTLSYLPITDQIVVDGQSIAASEMMARLPQVIAAQRQSPESTHSHALPVAAPRQTSLPPSRLHEYAETSLPQQSIEPPTASPQAAMLDGSPVAVLNRTFAQVASIGLPAALTEVTVTKPYSTFIFGQSEAGKDITLYNVIAALRAKFPTAYFLGIDGKNHAPERPLWGLYDSTLHLSMLDRPVDYHHRLLKALDTAVNFPAMAFIAFSEVNGISAAYSTAGMTEEWREIAHRIAYLAIQGNAAGKYLYATAQALNLDSLGIKKESRANCSFIAIANSTQFSFLSQIAGDTKVFNASVILNQSAFQSACSRSTATEHLKNHDILKGIAYFHTALNRWEPMPRLVNPGADRCNPITPPTLHNNALPAIIPVLDAIPATGDVDLDASIEAETIIDAALETLHANPGEEFSLTKLCLNRSQRSRYGDFLIEVLQESPHVGYRVSRKGNVSSHLFKWGTPNSEAL
jgi:hypothetical protein